MADADDSGLVARLPGAAAAGNLVGRSRDVARRARQGPWRVLVTEDSMRPALEPDDWLLVDPTIRLWPRRGAIVVVREPGTDLLVVKRLAARPGDVIRTPDGPIRLGRTQAWLLGDDRSKSHDSRAYGPVELDRLVARAFYRYGPRGRAGGLERASA